MPKSFTCQEPGCGARRTYDRESDAIVVDACANCGDAAYSLPAVAW